jgi:hypothetical protein
MGLIAFPSSYCSRSFSSSGSTGLSGAVSTLVLNGPSIPSKYAQNGGLAARVDTTLFTGGLQALCKWQVLDDDGLTFRDAVQAGNLANVAFNTGAGTSGGTRVVNFFAAPESVTASNRACRAVIYAAGSGPGAGTGFDTASIAYDFRAPNVPGLA